MAFSVLRVPVSSCWTMPPARSGRLCQSFKIAGNIVVLPRRRPNFSTKAAPINVLVVLTETETNTADSLSPSSDSGSDALLRETTCIQPEITRRGDSHVQELGSPSNRFDVTDVLQERYQQVAAVAISDGEATASDKLSAAVEQHCGCAPAVELQQLPDAKSMIVGQACGAHSVSPSNHDVHTPHTSESSLVASVEGLRVEFQATLHAESNDHVPSDKSANELQQSSAAIDDDSSNNQTQEPEQADMLKIWALIMLSLSYVHQSASGCSLPAMLPLISPDFNLSDFQGALLTSGYSYLYAIALIPVGLIADKVSRPLLLAGGLALWSALTMKMAQVHDYHELLLARVGFAAAQATQNPISFALIPDLFPRNKSTALAVYNCAIYFGRALSFAAVLLAKGVEDSDKVGVKMVPLERLDLHKTSIVYTHGDMAAVLPIYDYNYQIIEYGPVTESSWRHLFWWIGVPGLFIAALLAFTVREPRSKKSTASQTEKEASSDSCPSPDGSTQSTLPALHDSMALPARASTLVRQWVQKPSLAFAFAGGLAAPAEMSNSASAPPSAMNPPSLGSSLQSHFMDLWKNPAFQAVTIAAALNDVGSYALIAWHSTFYERVFELDSSVYAPMLAVVLPLGGIIGGVGGGFLADYLDKRGGRAWLTVGASLAASPFIAASLLAHNSNDSFLALLIGFGLSEAWRSPAAIMIRGIAPADKASTATAVYLCVRNLVGGMGPLAVAKLAEQVGLQKALLIAPACYLLSGAVFYLAEALSAQNRASALPPAELPPASS